MPCGQYFSQIGVIPSGLEPFGLDADLGRLLLLEQTHGHLSQEGHIFWDMAVRTRESSSRKTTSSTQCKEFSMLQ